MGALLSFWYGIIAGVLFVVLFFLYAFSKARRLLKFVGDRVFFRRSRRKRGGGGGVGSSAPRYLRLLGLHGDEEDEHGGDGTCSSSGSVRSVHSTGVGGGRVSSAASGRGSRRWAGDGPPPPHLPRWMLPSASTAKLVGQCQLACYDGAFVAPPHNCRVVLSGGTIAVYETLASRTQGNERVITAEHLKGYMMLDTITATALTLPPSQYHLGQKYSNPLSGRVIVVECRGGSLFSRGVADPIGAPSMRPDRRSPARDPASSLASSDISPSVHREASTAGSSEASAASVDPLAERPLSEWGSVVLKFAMPRESERWLNLLQATDFSHRWRAYIATIPPQITFNMLLSRLMMELNSNGGLERFIESKIQKKMRDIKKKFPRDVGGELVFDRLELGNEVPIVSNVTEPSVSENGEIGFGFDVLYRGGIVLHFRLNLTYRGIRIPHVVFDVHVLHVSGTAHISIGPPPTKKFWLSARHPPDVRLKFTQGIASGKGLLHAILTSLPDLSEIFTNLIKMYLFVDLVLPNMDDFPLPSIERTPAPTRRSSLHAKQGAEAAARSPTAGGTGDGGPDGARRSATPADGAPARGSSSPALGSSAASLSQPLAATARSQAARRDVASQSNGSTAPPSGRNHHHHPGPMEYSISTSDFETSTERSTVTDSEGSRRSAPNTGASLRRFFKAKAKALRKRSTGR